MKKYLIIVIIFFSCVDNEKKEFKNYFKDTPIINLKTEFFNLKYEDNVFFGGIGKIIHIGSLLIVVDHNPSYLMKIIDLKTNVVRNFGKKGKGPNELSSSFIAFSKDNFSNSLHVIDLPKYFVYSIDSLKQRKDKPSKRFQIERDKIDVFGNVEFCKGYLIGGSRSKRFGLYNLNTKFSLTKFNFEKGEGSLVNQAQFYSHPTKNKVVYFQFDYEVMGILTIEDNDIVNKEFSWWKEKGVEKTEGGRTFVKPSDNARKCFVSATTSEKYIYSLYSGKPRGKTIESVTNSSFTNFIYVFDWEGKPVKRFKLDREIRSIALDEKNNIFYASSVNENGEPILLKIQIDE